MQEWEDLKPIAVEQPFLFRHGEYIVGGVIDLVAGRGSDVYAIDHKLSTGQYLSQIPMMSAREQLGVYIYALRNAGLPAATGVLSRIKIQQDPEGKYVQSLATADGIVDVPDAPWGYTRLEEGRLTRALIVSDGKVLRVEREYLQFGVEEPREIVEDLLSCWEALYGQSFRIRGPHCGYCPYLARCNDDATSSIPAPMIDLERLHPELFRRLLPHESRD